jgi:hypothetical protein
MVGNRQGDALLAWVDASGSTVNSSVVKVSLRSAGGSFGPSQTISSPGGPQAPIALAMDPSGDAVAVWNRYDGSSDVIEAATRNAGGSFSAPGAAIPGATSGALYYPSVAMDAHGDAVATWDENVGGQIEVEASFRPAGGSFGTAHVISGTGASVPVVAMDPQGDAVALWPRSSGGQTKFEAAVRPAGGSFPSTGTVVSGAGAQGYPQIAMDGQGNTIASWIRAPGTGTVVETSFRPAGGSFPATGTAVSQANVSSDSLAVDSGGNAYLVWGRYDNSGSPSLSKIEASYRPSGGSFATPVVLKSVDTSTGESEEYPQVAADGAGNAVAIWTDFKQSTESVLAAGFDGAGPQLRSLSVPTAGIAGQPMSFSVSPVDVWSPVASTTWSFGDGTVGTGSSVSHTYSRPGSYTVSVTSTDSLGNASTSSAAAVVSATPPPPSRAPTLGSVSMTNRVFAVGPQSTAVSAAAKPRLGTVFRYSLSTAATVTIDLLRAVPGRKSKGRCVKPTKRLRHKARCTRYVGVGKLTRHGVTGANSTPFSGRVGRRALPPGHYAALITASDSAGTSQPTQLKFQIVKAANPKPRKPGLDLL